MRNCKTKKSTRRRNAGARKNITGKHRSGTKKRVIRRYRGGCEKCVGSSPSTAPVWKSSGGAHPEQISESIYNRLVDPVFYSVN